MKLKAFIYLLAQQKVPFGVIEDTLSTVEALAQDPAGIDYEDKNLSAWVDSVLRRLDIQTSKVILPISSVEKR